MGMGHLSVGWASPPAENEASVQEASQTTLAPLQMAPLISVVTNASAQAVI